MLERLANSFYELLQLLADYFRSGRAYLFLQRENDLNIITYVKKNAQYSNDRITLNDKTAQIFELNSEEDIPFSRFAPDIQTVFTLNGSGEDTSYRLLDSGSAAGQNYAVFLSADPKLDRESLKESTLRKVIGLYVENGVMKEKLRYESEHDKLSGLYNKGKYMAMLETVYPNLSSIAIFNMDVNNLKVMNDTYGHEAGDRLLIKAADSIRKVTNNKIHGYRMGGDEFMMIACDISEADAEQIKERWEAELARLNTKDEGINCVIAVGIVYAEKPYDLPELLKEADARMYEDKKRKKKPGEEIR